MCQENEAENTCVSPFLHFLFGSIFSSSVSHSDDCWCRYSLFSTRLLSRHYSCTHTLNEHLSSNYIKLAGCSGKKYIFSFNFESCYTHFITLCPMKFNDWHSNRPKIPFIYTQFLPSMCLYVSLSVHFKTTWFYGRKHSHFLFLVKSTRICLRPHNDRECLHVRVCARNRM